MADMAPLPLGPVNARFGQGEWWLEVRVLFLLLAIEAGIASFWPSVAGSLLKICLAAW